MYLCLLPFIRHSDGLRISQCDAINLEGLLTAHREMGKIEYYMLYKHQPVIFRDGANPGW